MSSDGFLDLQQTLFPNPEINTIIPRLITVNITTRSAVQNLELKEWFKDVEMASGGDRNQQFYTLNDRENWYQINADSNKLGYVFNELSLYWVDPFGKKSLYFNQYAKQPMRFEEIQGSKDLVQI